MANRDDPSSGPWKAAAGYGSMVVGALVVFLVVRVYGAHLVAPPPSAARAAGGAVVPAASDTLMHVLLALIVIILAARARLLNLGLDLGLISPTLFAMLVLMAVVTTLATTPILHLLTGSSAPAGSTETART